MPVVPRYYGRMNNPRFNTVHSISVPVRWSDFDRDGRLLNSAYIELAQEARRRFVAEQFSAISQDFSVVLRRLEVDYQRPVLPDSSSVRVETAITDVTSMSFTTHHILKDCSGAVCAVVDCVQTALDTTSYEPRFITQQEKLVLTQRKGAEGAVAVDADAGVAGSGGVAEDAVAGGAGVAEDAVAGGAGSAGTA